MHFMAVQRVFHLNNRHFMPWERHFNDMRQHFICAIGYSRTCEWSSMFRRVENIGMFEKEEDFMKMKWPS